MTDQPRGPVDWARQQAAERETRPATSDLQQRITQAIRDTPARYPDDIAKAVMRVPELRVALARSKRHEATIDRVRTLAAELFVAGRTEAERAIGRRLLNALQPPAPGHDGPTVAEAAADDAAHWDAKYAGEGQ
jgi:hypothetical protein